MDKRILPPSIVLLCRQTKRSNLLLAPLSGYASLYHKNAPKNAAGENFRHKPRHASNNVDIQRSATAPCSRSAPVSFRAKLFLVFLITVLASVSVVAYGVTHYTRAAFEEGDTERTEALVAQFKKEFAQRGEEVAQQVENVANGEITLKVAIDLARPNADQSLYVHDAIGVAQDHGLDFVEFVNSDGTLISSAQYPSRVGYKNDWVTAAKDWRGTKAFLKKEELPDGVALSLTAVRTVSGGNDKSLYIIGGHRLDQNFLASLVLPSGMRALLYRNLEPSFISSALTDVNGTADQPERFQPLIEPMNEQLHMMLQGSSRTKLVIPAEPLATTAEVVSSINPLRELPTS